jgi:hypothetical protein
MVHALPLVIGGALLLLAIIASAYAATRPDESIGVQTRERFARGSCVVIRNPDDDATRTATEVPCSDPHDFRVTVRVDIPVSCPPNTVNIPLFGERISLCVTR